jgi:hypothetical protein
VPSLLASPRRAVVNDIRSQTPIISPFPFTCSSYVVPGTAQNKGSEPARGI